MNRIASAVRRSGALELGAGIHAGCFVAVAGPSGAGKDTLISGAQDRLADDKRFVFARRIITRSADCTEDHDTLTELEFARMGAAGAFLLSWMANGLSYALPSGLGLDIEDGRIVIANVSRAILPEVRQRFPRNLVVHVTAAPDVLAARLSARGREDTAAQQARLSRALLYDVTVSADITIDNSDNLDRSLMEFEQTLKSLAYTVPLGL
jgi:ribose 1,5-bisphosphokinase